MSVRVPAPRVAARGELAHTLCVQEAARADAARGDEEVPPPAALLECVGGEERGRAPVVERERGDALPAGVPERDVRYRVEVSVEMGGVELVSPRHRPGEAHRVALGRRRDVVVDQRERQARARARWRAITLPISFTTA